nr:hypothetical protein Iba_chr02bCG16490 [Ipomoea batatas]GME06265.1 hypothetical protein Iba_scaffold3983CG0060 [Ipomoea batatas]
MVEMEMEHIQMYVLLRIKRKIAGEKIKLQVLQTMSLVAIRIIVSLPTS